MDECALLRAVFGLRGRSLPLSPLVCSSLAGYLSKMLVLPQNSHTFYCSTAPFFFLARTKGSLRSYFSLSSFCDDRRILSAQPISPPLPPSGVLKHLRTFHPYFCFFPAAAAAAAAAIPRLPQCRHRRWNCHRWRPGRR